VTFDADAENRLRHVIAFFMQEAKDEAEARFSVESMNRTITTRLQAATEDNNRLKADLDKLLHEAVTLYPDFVINGSNVVEHITAILKTGATALASGHELNDIMGNLESMYARLYPDSIPVRDNEHLYHRLVKILEDWSEVRRAYLELFGVDAVDPNSSTAQNIAAKLLYVSQSRGVDRCYICDHLMSLHDFNDNRGCRRTVSKDQRCPCDRSILTEEARTDDAGTERGPAHASGADSPHDG
jgi:hypothetical protein